MRRRIDSACRPLRGGQIIESIPIAAVGRIKVVSVDYRMAPEYRFPAASEDAARVYAELLKQYRPGNVGFYGCSAGGELSAQAVAWLQRHGLPRPGAIGIFGAGAYGSHTGSPADAHVWGGDSRYIVPPLIRQASRKRSSSGAALEGRRRGVLADRPCYPRINSDWRSRGRRRFR